MTDFKQRVADFHELTKEVADKAHKALAEELTLDQALRLEQLLDQHENNATQLLTELQRVSEEEKLISAARALDLIATQLAMAAAHAVVAKRVEVGNKDET